MDVDEDNGRRLRFVLNCCPDWFAVLPWAGLALLGLGGILLHHQVPHLIILLVGYCGGMAWGLGGMYLIERWTGR
jgi:hypothetical protein